MKYSTVLRKLGSKVCKRPTLGLKVKPRKRPACLNILGFGEPSRHEFYPSALTHFLWALECPVIKGWQHLTLVSFHSDSSVELGEAQVPKFR